jgi:hypothetical protein
MPVGVLYSLSDSMTTLPPGQSGILLRFVAPESQFQFFRGFHASTFRRTAGAGLVLAFCVHRKQ